VPFSFEEPFGYTVFCDDIRNEVGGKNTYVGVYTGNLAVPSFPAILPKFGIVATLLEPRAMAEARDWNITVHIYLPGDATDGPTLTASLPPVPKELYATLDASPVPDDPDVPRLIMVSAGFILSPMTLREPGRIKVRALYKDETIIKLGSIKIEAARQPEQSEQAKAG
jgi:hypothetical protein